MTTTACDDQFAKEPDPPKTVAVCARTHTSDQVLTGNYLQIDAEKLEEECRLARDRGNVVCVWQTDLITGSHKTNCDKTWWAGNLQHPSLHFSLCPFCGKQIKVKT
jgi:hypothetical protein